MRPWKNIAPRVGRRGAYLLIKGVMFFILGLSYLAFPTSETAKEVLRYALFFAPMEVWGGAWIVTAVVAILCAFRNGGPHRDRWGFLALISMAMLWAGAYLAICLAELGGDLTLAARGLTGFLLFGSFSGAIIIVSGWPEPVDETTIDRLIHQ